MEKWESFDDAQKRVEEEGRKVAKPLTRKEIKKQVATRMGKIGGNQ